MVDFATGFEDARLLTRFRRLVVHRDALLHLAEVFGRDGSRVADIGTVDLGGCNEQDDSAGAGTVANRYQILFHELDLPRPTPLLQGTLEVAGKLGLRRDVVVEVVTEELGAPLAPMPVKNGEELDLELGLLLAVEAQTWFLQVEHD